MSSLYIKEATGVDELTTAGSQDHPFKTPAYALFASQQKSDATEPKLFVFKTEDNEYQEISASALKKARKGCDGLKKRQSSKRNRS